MAISTCGLNITDSLKELQPHGSVAFPCAAYDSFHDLCEEDNIPWHRHEELEIIHVVSGTMCLRVPGQEFIVHSGETIFINSDITHFSKAIEPYTLNSFVFSPLLLTGSSTSVYNQKFLSPIITCPDLAAVMIRDPNSASYFKTAFEAMRDDRFAYEFDVRHSLSMLVLMVFNENRDLLTIPENEDDIDAIRMETMMSFIHDHHRDQITLTDIASSAGIGERECLRCFKRTMQTSPVQYLMKYRLMRSASILLAMPSWTITEVSADCGFGSSSYFTELFKRYYKMTPKAFRKKHF